jgi:hypothetical protein
MVPVAWWRVIRTSIYRRIKATVRGQVTGQVLHPDGKALLIGYVKYSEVYPGIFQLDGVFVKRMFVPVCEEMRCEGIIKGIDERIYKLVKFAGFVKTNIYDGQTLPKKGR